MKALITKYALSSGVIVTEGELSESEGYRRPMFCDRKPGEFHNYYHGGEFHLAKEEAIIQVETMARQRRKSLEKSLAGIEWAKAKALKQIEEADL
jgi:hypothetical protein